MDAMVFGLAFVFQLAMILGIIFLALAAVYAFVWIVLHVIFYLRRYCK